MIFSSFAWTSQEPPNGIVAITDYDEIDFKEAKVQDDDPEDSNKQEDEKEKEKL